MSVEHGMYVVGGTIVLFVIALLVKRVVEEMRRPKR